MVTTNAAISDSRHVIKAESRIVEISGSTSHSFVSPSYQLPPFFTFTKITLNGLGFKASKKWDNKAFIHVFVIVVIG